MTGVVELNQIRLVCNDADRGSLHVKSTFEKTERMEHRTDESISFPDDHIVIIKNMRESKCVIRLESIRLGEGKYFIVRPSRQPVKKILSKRMSEIGTSCALALGGGESVVIFSSAWTPQTGIGSNVGAV